MSISAALGLPYLAPSQAQKHVTHNEALRLLDLIVQLTVADRTRTAPPATATEGQRHIVGAAPTGDWAGHAGEIAVFEAGAWSFLTPGPGWKAYVQAEAAVAVWTGSAWASLAPDFYNLPGVGMTVIATRSERRTETDSATAISRNN